jgi:transposase-like protein
LPLTVTQLKRALAKALLDGHADTIRTRAVAFAICVGEITVREAARKYSVSASTLYSAQRDISNSILSHTRSVMLANEINSSVNSENVFPHKSGNCQAAG